MTIYEAMDTVISLARSEIGYKPSKKNFTKYSEELDKTDTYNGKKNGYADWCDIFYDWLFIHSFGAEIGQKMIYQPKKGCGAGCGYSASYYRSNGAWMNTPELGAQIFFGDKGKEEHTGIVTDFDDTYVYTIEGNTGVPRQVAAKKYRKNAKYITGYGIPNWSLASKVPEPKPNEKTIEEIAREVLAGKWGNGLTRKKRLEAAGYNYTKVQEKVNELLKKPGKKSVEEIAREVLAGKWGNGILRKKRLEAAGYNYNEVQNKVNELLKGKK